MAHMQFQPSLHTSWTPHIQYVTDGNAGMLVHNFTTLRPCRSEVQDTVADLRAQLQSQAGQLQSQAGQLDSATALEGVLAEQQREVDRLHSQLLEQQQANDGLQREATLAHIQLQESREAFRVRIQHCMLEVCRQWVMKSSSCPAYACLLLHYHKAHMPHNGILHVRCWSGAGVVWSGLLWRGVVCCAVAL